MRAVEIREHGDPSVLHVAERPVPEPGPGQALVRVHAVAVNRLDLWVRQNDGHMLQTRLPLVPGYDVAGIVTALGAGVEGLDVGAAVYVYPDQGCGRCRHCLSDNVPLCPHYSIMGVERDGGYADYVTARAEDVLVLGPRTAPEDAAAVGSVYATAYQMLFDRAAIRPGETVMTMAAGSGVGGGALHLARLAGCRVIATAGSAAKLERALEEGADAAVSYAEPDWADRVLELTGGEGVDVAIDHVGSATFEEVVRATRRAGRIVVCGASSGPETRLDLLSLFSRQVSILGSTGGTKRGQYHLLRLLDAGRIPSRIETRLPLDQAAEAHRRLERRAHYGRILLIPG